jgi:predicted nuclease of predicted toxin-antitoxin system
MSATSLRFLADENCDFAVVCALRDVGHDVVAVSEYTQRSRDDELIAQAHSEKRILLTEDKDFGWLVFVSHADTFGVILFRFPGNARQTMAQAAVELACEQGASLYGTFVVVQPGYVRISHRSDLQR